MADEWTAVQGGVGEVRDAARRYLENMTDEDLNLSIPYSGSVTSLRERGLVLRYAIMRSSAHHYFHIGEIVSKRDRLGHDVGDYPGLLEECI